MGCPPCSRRSWLLAWRSPINRTFPHARRKRLGSRRKFAATEIYDAKSVATPACRPRSFNRETFKRSGARCDPPHQPGRRALHRRAGGRHRPFTLLACRAAGFEPEVAGHGGDFGLTTALVVRGGAVALIPRMALRATDRVVGLRLSEPKLERRVVAATRAGSARVPAVAALLGALRRAAAPAWASGHFPALRAEAGGSRVHPDQVTSRRRPVCTS